MRYEEELIEEVREKNDIVDVISSYVSLKKKGSSWFGLCPFHNERTPLPKSIPKIFIALAAENILMLSVSRRRCSA